MRNWFSRHPIWFMAFYLVFYLSVFHWLEVNITVPEVWVHCHLDDLIPFCKYAVIPYLAWFIWIPFTLFYLLWKAPPPLDAPGVCGAVPVHHRLHRAAQTAQLHRCGHGHPAGHGSGQRRLLAGAERVPHFVESLSFIQQKKHLRRRCFFCCLKQSFRQADVVPGDFFP